MQISGALGRLVTVTPKLTSKGHVRINQCKERAHYQSKVGNYLLSFLSCSSMVPTAVRLSAETERQTHTPPRARAHAQAPAAGVASTRTRTRSRLPAHCGGAPFCFLHVYCSPRAQAGWWLRPRGKRLCGVERGRAGWPHGAPQKPRTKSPQLRSRRRTSGAQFISKMRIH